MRRAIVSNVTGNLLSFVFSLIAVPIQILLLGAESYGLIGFIASLQLALMLLDFGLSSSVVREIAAGGDRALAGRIIQTGATVYWIVSVTVAGAVFIAADWIASEWLNPQTLTPEYLAGAQRIIAVYMALTWPVGHYANVLFAFHRLDVVNALKVIVNFTTQIGGIAVIVITRDVAAFLIWITINACVSLILHLICVRRIAPDVPLMLGFSRQAIRRLWRTSFDMNIVSTAATAYTQLDKLLISVLLPLSQLGYYNAAYRLMAGATLIPVSVASTTLPVFTTQFASGQRDALITTYNRTVQLMMFLMCGLGFGLIFWGREILTLWTSPEAAQSAYPPLVLLVLGAVLNSITVPAYYLLLASGKSRLLSKVYGIGVLPYALLLLALTQYAGIVGAALSSILFSLYLIGTTMLSVVRQLDVREPAYWFNRHITAFMLTAALVFGAGYMLLWLNTAPPGWLIWGVGVLSGMVYGAVGLMMIEARSRTALFELLHLSRFVRVQREN
jgi:O-antigen/teichoic acid export membrane protein